jgi:hypothetical protein
MEFEEGEKNMRTKHDFDYYIDRILEYQRLVKVGLDKQSVLALSSVISSIVLEIFILLIEWRFKSEEVCSQK